MTKRARQSRNEPSRKKRRQEPEGAEVAVEVPTLESYSDSDSGYSEDHDIDTHPRNFDHHHVERLQEFTNDLNQALQGSLAPPTCPYTAVHVLLLRWDEDDLGVHSEISRLSSVFEDQFRFEVEEWNIPTVDPYHSLQDKIFHLQKTHQTRSDLLIIYYGGHSHPDTRRGRSIWHANRLATSPSLEWFNIQPMLLTAKPHVLMILDCCFAANAARDTTEGSSKELLAACGRENQTPGVGIRSFTSVLIEELQSFGGTPFTVAMLHARLITLRHKLAYTPIYAALAEKGGNSIVISPLLKSPSPLPQGSECPTGPGSNMGTAPLAVPTPVSLAGGTRVLLAVSVAEGVAHNVEQWVSWLTTVVPWGVLKVECMYESHSTLLLVSVPIVGWSRLPESAAYRFIGFIKSGNLVCEKANPRPIPEVTLQPIADNASSSGRSGDARIKRNLIREKADPPPITEMIPQPVSVEASSSGSSREARIERPTIADTHPSVTTTMPNRTYSPKASGADRHASQSWPPDKDDLLMRARQQGMNWQPIADKYFPDKTANACRKRYERLMEKRNNTENWEDVKIETLSKAYNDLREQMWKTIGDQVGEKWQTVEAKCLETGIKSLQCIARAASRRSRFSPAINDSDDEITLTPRALTSGTKSHQEAAKDISSGVSFGADRHIGQLAPIQLPKLPNFNNIFAEPNRSYNIESPYYQASAVTTH